MKIVCFIILFVWTHILLGQEKLKTSHFGISVMPQLNITSFGKSKWIDNKASLGVDIGGDIYFDISVRSQIRTGLHFHQISLRQRDYSPLFPDDNMNGQADIYKSYYEFKSSYSFIGVPIEYRLKISQKPNHIFIVSGLHGRYKLNSSGNVKLIESSVNTIMLDPENFIFETKKIQSYFIVGGGYEWVAGSKKLSISPILEYSFNKIFDTLSSSLQNGNFTFLGLRVSIY